MQDSLVLEGQSPNIAPNPSSPADLPPTPPEIDAELSAEAQQRLEVLQSLIETCDRATITCPN